MKTTPPPTPFLLLTALLIPILQPTSALPLQAAPNIILVMADDQGWGQTGYNGHPLLKTPHLDDMAAHSLRLDRFYAGAPNCSPTRATVLTGRSNDRTGVHNHGFALRRQEKTLAQALQTAGYTTAHFGKWHLNGIRGPGVPLLAEDDHHPGHFGFDHWLSTSNFFDRDPLLSREGQIENFCGDSSEIIVREALHFISQQRSTSKPFFAVIWYGSPHSPFHAQEKDRTDFKDLSLPHAQHHGELVAMDRSIGTLRKGLRDLGVHPNTLLWYCSDNGGLPNIKPSTVAHLRGFKNSVYEGGLRVPCLIEWPDVISAPRISKYPASTLDIFPTLAEIVGIPSTQMQQPTDGLSLVPLIRSENHATRIKPIPFRHTQRAAWLDYPYKLITQNVKQSKYELYHLENDPSESNNLLQSHPEIARKLIHDFEKWNLSVEDSQGGKDYPEGTVNPNEPEPTDWTVHPAYQPYLPHWKLRPEYSSRIK